MQGRTSAGNKNLSPPRATNLPADKVNKPKGVGLSHVRNASPPQQQTSKITGVNNVNSGKAAKRIKLSSNDNINVGTSGQVSDNREQNAVCADETQPGPEDIQEQIKQSAGNPEKALMLVLEELREIKTQMVKLNRLEDTTASLAEQLATNIAKTGELESTVNQHTSKFQEMKEQVDSLTSKLEQQDSQIQSLNSLKDDISSSTDETVKQMNDLIDTQRQQVDSFNSGARQLQKDWKEDVMSEVKKEFRKHENRKHCQSLKDQAFKNRNNLVVMGLPEEKEKSSLQVVQDFFKNSLKTENLDIQHPGSYSEYVRPLLVQFNKLAQRNRLWRNRGNITQTKEDSLIKPRIQADLPKELREGVQALYQVAKAADKMDEFENVQVRNYQLEINGETYQISDLEDLPVKIRPSTLASPRSDTHLVFFSKRAKLSNHFPSKFNVDGQDFGSMEHYLAVRRAELSEKEELIQRAHQVKDPIQAKYILNLLHNDHQEQWDTSIEELVMIGLRAKFYQNPALQEYLCSTRDLIPGEASTNPRWGIGMDIHNPEVLDPSKWSQTGNLLGNSLMKLRKELLEQRKSHPK